MTSSSLNYISIGVAALSVSVSLFAVWQNRSLNRLKKTFFAGKSGTDLESIIYSLSSNLNDAREEQFILEKNFFDLKNNFGFAIQKIGMVRFNPFADGGGNFSFCLALLDGHNSGIVLTSMHGREQNRIYAKHIQKGKCEIQLTEEEEKAIITANSKIQEPNTKQIPKNNI